MNYFNTCNHCGNTVTAYSHRLNAQLVDALVQLVEFWRAKKRGCNLQNDLQLSKNQYNNFQKLQYFRVVTNREDGWYPTGKGCQFVDGSIEIEKNVATFGKMILDSNHEAWGTTEAKPEPIHISNVKNYTWKKREDYIA